MDILNQTDFTDVDILKIIELRIEESVNVEFKAAAALAKTDGSKKEIAKDVSAMANSDGGVIIYGINEVDHVAHSISYVNGRDLPKEWLESVIISNIQQRIDNIIITPVRFNDDLTQTIYVVRVPRSPRAPHMTTDKRYFKRFNYQAVPMEEYEIRDIYFRRGSGELVFEEITFSKPEFDYEEGTFSCLLSILVTNDSQSIVEIYKLGCWFTIPASGSMGFHYEPGYSLTRTIDNLTKISTTSSSPIFPTEVLTLMTVEITVDIIHLTTSVSEINAKAILHYPGGTKEYEMALGEQLQNIAKKQQVQR